MTSNEQESGEVSKGGSKVFRHSQSKDFEAPKGEGHIEQISAHIEQHLGKVELVIHEIVSDVVHIDVHQVNPTQDFPFWRLVTSGMSDLPMTVPEGHDDVPKFLELMLTLPGDWRLDQQSFEDENWYWPVRLLKSLARLPHKYNTWLGWGHTIPNGDPPEPYASNTQLAGAIILPSLTVPQDFLRLKIDESKEIVFLSVVPLYREEMDLKLQKGTDALTDRFDKHGLADIVDPVRKNVAKKLFGIF